MASILSSTEMWAALLGAVVGSTVTGVIEYLIKRKELKEQDLIRRAEQKSFDQRVASSLLFKVIEMHSVATNILNVINQCIHEWNGDGKLEDNLWRAVLQIPNLPENVRFSSEEMAMLFGLGDADTFNKVLLMDSRYNSTIDVLRRYDQLRHLFKNSFPPMVFDQGIGGIMAVRERGARMQAETFEMNQLISGALKNLQKDIAATEQAIKDLSKLFTDKLGMKLNFRRASVSS